MIIHIQSSTICHCKTHTVLKYMSWWYTYSPQLYVKMIHIQSSPIFHDNTYGPWLNVKIMHLWSSTICQDICMCMSICMHMSAIIHNRFSLCLLSFITYTRFSYNIFNHQHIFTAMYLKLSPPDAVLVIAYTADHVTRYYMVLTWMHSYKYLLLEFS